MENLDFIDCGFYILGETAKDTYDSRSYDAKQKLLNDVRVLAKMNVDSEFLESLDPLKVSMTIVEKVNLVRASSFPRVSRVRLIDQNARSYPLKLAAAHKAYFSFKKLEWYNTLSGMEKLEFSDTSLELAHYDDEKLFHIVRWWDNGPYHLNIIHYSRMIRKHLLG